MAHGHVKSKIHDKFSDRIKDLEEQANKQSEHFRTHNGVRPWHTPESMKTRDLLDVPNLHEPAWNRDTINQNYCLDVVAGDATSAGTTGDIKALKVQIDFMAVEERAWRLRHATAVRCAAVAHGRLSGHGAKNNSVFSMVKTAAENYRISGGVTG
jgi:hypothetical protein